MSGPPCIECGKEAKLVDGRRIYPHRPDLYAKWFWLCSCGAYCGCHGETKDPLGYPCGPVTRRARSAAHAAFDPIWRRKMLKRSDAYARLAEELAIPAEECHIGMMSADRARQVPIAVQRIMESV